MPSLWLPILPTYLPSSWYCILLVTMSVNCFAFRCVLEVWESCLNIWWAIWFFKGVAARLNKSQNPVLSEGIVDHQDETYCHLSSARERSLSDQFKSILSSCPPSLRWVVECCTEKGSSSWLSALPLEQYGFALHKGEFIGAICLRYDHGSHPIVCVARILVYPMPLAVHTMHF